MNHFSFLDSALADVCKRLEVVELHIRCSFVALAALCPDAVGSLELRAVSYVQIVEVPADRCFARYPALARQPQRFVAFGSSRSHVDEVRAGYVVELVVTSIASGGVEGVHRVVPRMSVSVVQLVVCKYVKNQWRFENKIIIKIDAVFKVEFSPAVGRSSTLVLESLLRAAAISSSQYWSEVLRDLGPFLVLVAVLVEALRRLCCS